MYNDHYTLAINNDDTHTNTWSILVTNSLLCGGGGGVHTTSGLGGYITPSAWGASPSGSCFPALGFPSVPDTFVGESAGGGRGLSLVVVPAKVAAGARLGVRAARSMQCWCCYVLGFRQGIMFF